MKLTLAAAIAALMLGGVAQAADAPQSAAETRGDAAAAAANPSRMEPGQARRLALARRYFAALHYDALMDSMMKSLLPVLLESQTKRYPNLPPTFKQALTDVTMEAMHDVTPSVMDDAVQGMSEIYTEDELTKLVNFYESDAGQSIMRKSGQLTEVMSGTVRKMIPRMQADMMERLCKKIDCKTLPKPADRHPS